MIIICAGYVSAMEEARDVCWRNSEGHLTDMTMDVKIIALSV
jgi:hypothetical protein